MAWVIVFSQSNFNCSFEKSDIKKIKIKSERDNSFQIANGDIVTGATYLIEKMKIGKFEINDIECSVLDNTNASNLLGLNALLARTNYFSINTDSEELNFF